MLLACGGNYDGKAAVWNLEILLKRSLQSLQRTSLIIIVAEIGNPTVRPIIIPVIYHR